MKHRYPDHPASRRQALEAATHEHDGAWRDPLALKLIADEYRVDPQWLATESARRVREREARVAAQPLEESVGETMDNAAVARAEHSADACEP
jgi:hypothetical protein